MRFRYEHWPYEGVFPHCFICADREAYGASKEIIEWCTQQFGKDYRMSENDPIPVWYHLGNEFTFQRDADATLFKMMWCRD